jgi:hypothetical protein
LVETWTMRVSFLYWASGLFIGPSSRSDNYKRELKREKRKASDAVKAGTVSLWKSQTEQLADIQWRVSQNSEVGQLIWPDRYIHHQAKVINSYWWLQIISQSGLKPFESRL